MTIELIHGDCLPVLRELKPESVDSVVTDPPYGLSFMGKKWDYDVPSVEIWQEVLRGLKPGGHLLSFGGTRTYHRMAVAIEDAGFEIRDQIQWLYGSGFPKSHNLKGDFAGFGSALKPANEPICLARKPLIGTIAENVLEHGTGALNIDGCRVSTEDVLSFGSRELGDGIKYGKCKPTTEGVQSALGRWPANVIHDGSPEVIALFPQTKNGGQNSTSPGAKSMFGIGAANGIGSTIYAGDSGSAARFFYTAKASKADRGEGNVHPTVKPTSLMQYLCRLVTPPGGVVLDPFMGSGSTGRGAVLEGFSFIGIEREEEYFRSAQTRIAECQMQGRIDY